VIFPVVSPHNFLKASGDNLTRSIKRSGSTFVVGVTGGIGSGKTTVCNLFHELFGIPIIDADIIAKDVVKKNQPALQAIVAEFGDSILTESGELDRPKVKKLVFSDPTRRKILERIVHPEVRKEMNVQISRVSASYCLLSVPLIAESTNKSMFDRILVVDCDEKIQMERVISRDKLANATVVAIMNTQASRKDRLAIADDIIVNNGPTSQLNDQVQSLHETYQALPTADN
jgi:dephospho-CoA kinase